MLEKDWQSRVVDLAKVLGYRIAHFRPAQTARGWRTPMLGTPGWPDLVLCRPPRVIFAELKVGSAVRPEQAEWLEQLAAAGCETYIWRGPGDWDQVVDVLRAKERPGG